MNEDQRLSGQFAKTAEKELRERIKANRGELDKTDAALPTVAAYLRLESRAVAIELIRRAHDALGRAEELLLEFAEPKPEH